MSNDPEFKRNRAMQAIKRETTKRIIAVLLVVLGLAVLTAWGISYSRSRSKDLPGKSIPDQGREHVPLSEKHEYNSNPPVSGWHYAVPAEWGIYKDELDDKILIHNLEHGGIWISYKPGIPEDIRKKLEGFYDKYGRKVIIAPRSANDADIALAAWNRLDKFSIGEYSDERVEKFIKALRNKGPEFVP